MKKPLSSTDEWRSYSVLKKLVVCGSFIAVVVGAVLLKFSWSILGMAAGTVLAVLGVSALSWLGLWSKHEN